MSGNPVILIDIDLKTYLLIYFILITDVLKGFMSQSFDVQSYTTTVIQSTNITNRLAELEQGINVLDIELQTQVCYILK